MTPNPIPLVTLYTRQNCCLCDQAKAVVAAARARAEFTYEEIDIDSDPDLVRRYNDEVPVIAIDRVKAFIYKLDMDQFLQKLAARR
jgi:glutaredoxin